MMADGMLRRLEGIGDSILLAHIFVKGVRCPLILLNPCGLFLFFESGDLRTKKEEILDDVRVLQDALGVVRSKLQVYSMDENGGWTWLDMRSGTVRQVADPAVHAIACIQSGLPSFQPERLLCFEEKLASCREKQAKGTGQGSRKEGKMRRSIKRIRGTAILEGRTYIRRRGHWCPASKENSDEIFRKTCLFGLFGWFQFHTGHFPAGILYVLTCGFFGFGWIFDVLLLLAGLAKDGKGYYYAPVTDRRTGVCMLLTCTAAALVLVALYIWAMGVAGHLIAGMYYPG